MTARRRNAGGEVRRGRLFRTELFRMRMTQCNAARAGSRHSVLQETHPVHKRVDREQSKASMILCRPYGAANVGASARLAKNFGHRLVLVDPSACVVKPKHSDLEHDEIRTTTSKMDLIFQDEVIENACRGGQDILEDTPIFDSLDDALLFEENQGREGLKDDRLSPISICFATTVRTNRTNSTVEDVYDAKSAARFAVNILRSGGHVSFLFGNERSGLTNEEIKWANGGIVSIPTRIEYPYPGSSLNLSHAFAIISYELYVESMDAVVTSSSILSHSDASSDGRQPSPSHVERNGRETQFRLQEGIPFSTKVALHTKILEALQINDIISLPEVEINDNVCEESSEANDDANERLHEGDENSNGRRLSLQEADRRIAGLLNHKDLTMKEVSLLFSMANALRKGNTTC